MSNLNVPFTAIDPATGAVKYAGTASNPQALANANTTIIEGYVFQGAGWVENLTFYPVPQQPSPHHTWDWVTKEWADQRSLEEVKTAKWEEIKLARNAQEFDKFTWDGSDFDSDLTSQSRIQGGSQLATLAILNSQPFSIDWTLYDNTVRTLSAEDMIAVGQAMGLHINATHSHGRAKREALDAATTRAEVDAIQW